MTLTPAYGRDYKSKAEVMRAWEEGVDWQIASIMDGAGRYVSRRDIPSGQQVNIRYAKLTKVLPITVK